MRASGGLIGAVGTVMITDGKIEIGDFEGTAKFPGYHLTARNLSEDENRIYREEGPMSLNYDARDIANSPDTVPIPVDRLDVDALRDIGEFRCRVLRHVIHHVGHHAHNAHAAFDAGQFLGERPQRAEQQPWHARQGRLLHAGGCRRIHSEPAQVAPRWQ